MKPILVKDLLKELNRLNNNGKGDCVVLVSDDEECNGFHSLWYHYADVDGEMFTYLDGRQKVTASTVKFA